MPVWFYMTLCWFVLNLLYVVCVLKLYASSSHQNWIVPQFVTLFCMNPSMMPLFVLFELWMVLSNVAKYTGNICHMPLIVCFLLVYCFSTLTWTPLCKATCHSSSMSHLPGFCGRHYGKQSRECIFLWLELKSWAAQERNSNSDDGLQQQQWGCCWQIICPAIYKLILQCTCPLQQSTQRQVLIYLLILQMLHDFTTGCWLVCAYLFNGSCWWQHQLMAGICFFGTALNDGSDY